MRRAAILAAAGLGLAAAAAPLAAQAIGIPVGQTPPAAQVETLDGETVDLATFVGSRPLVVEFWATWCEICQALLPRMEAAHRRYGDRVDFLVIGVGVNQTRASIQRHLARHPLPFRFFFDARGAAVRAFQAPATGYIVALDARGRVTYTGAGADQDVEAVARRAAGN